MHRLHVTGFFAFEPQLGARTTEVNGTAQLGSLCQRLAVHPREHQDIVRALLLRNHRHQALRIPSDFI